MIVITSILSIAIFVFALHLSGVIRVGAGILPIARQSIQAMQNPDLNDDEKERAVQQASLALARAFGSILVRSVATLALSFVPIAAADLAGLATTDDVLSYLSRWDVIAAATAIIVGGYVLRAKLWPSR